MEGQHFSISCIEELFENPASVSDEHIQEISLPLYQSKDLSWHLESFSKLMSSFSKDSTFFLDTSLHTDDINEVGSSRQMDLFYECSDDEFESALEEIKREINMDDIVMELGYGCTVNSSHCRDVLSLFQPLTEVMLSKLLAAIARTHTGLEDTQIIHSTFCLALTSGSICDSSLLNSWNVDVLVDSIKQLAPKTNWTRVMESLDHEGFAIPDKASFSFLMSIYAKACQDPFPLHAICGSVWKNIEGQISFLRHAIASPPDVFTFSHCSRRLSYPDSLHLSNGQGNQAWFCLELLEVLCQLAERGHIGSVRAMLQYPIVHFPEVLLIGIAQINTSYNLLQYEVSCDVFPSILKDSPNNIVIHFLWHLNPNLVLRGFVDAHKDPSSLSRILDVCQELKILSSVLDTTPFSFSIRLAAIASRKEHINLEKWINENLNTDKDAFFEECLKFLKEMNSNMASDIPDNPLQQSRTGALNAYQETYTVIFKALLGYSGKLTSPQLLENFESLDGPFVPKVQNDGATDLTNVEGSPHDIEAETNAYFHQLFSGQLTVEAMIQMLARFKESSDRREQQIFESVIGNLFEEYKFFPKYPDQQLKLTAVLVGSLIKHQLVNHLALGIALRFVLDALRKSVDSRMFAFGTKALEQFMDRLIEWPQYCNHILQISHLRGTHAELVSVIEQTLARISSSQSESNISNTLPADQLQSPPVPSVENRDEPSEVPWTGSSSSQAGHQLSSFQLQQRQQGFLGDNKPNVSSPNYTMPLLSQARQPSVVSSPSDSVTGHKSLQAPQPQHSASVLSGISSSPGFTRPRGSGSAGMPRQPSYNTGFGSALNIETLVAAAEQRDITIEAPTSDIQDKIFFMINNISNVNVEAKAKEFTEVIKEQYYPWFARYMVMKRASIEPNFHDLYLKFLDKANSKALNKEIVKATYENCKVLLRSELIKSSSEERSLLKNLGSWLGKFTIGRNQALLAKEIDPKALIQEAYEKGLMIAVIPFTSKVLEPCQSSLAYRPPNPWTMGILGLLVEIYNLPNLKMNLKFDIEVLFKNLAVDMKTVVPTSLLKDRVREIEGNPDFSNKDIIASQPPVITEVSPGIMPAISQLEIQPAVNTSHPTSIPNVPTQYTGPFHLPSNVMVEDEKPGPLVVPERGPSAQGLTPVASSPSPFALNQLLTIIPKSDSYININPKLVSMGSQLQFHRIIQMAMDKAIREIVSPIIQRSVTIAIRTTKELVLKDYALEMDDSVISRAAHLMVGTLAGSLAHVTCKEPLRVALSNQLRSVLQNLNVATERAEQIIQIILTDHLDLGCAVIENVASDKAMELIDGDIGPSFTSMRKQRELSGSPYYDAGTYVQGTFVHVPEALRPKPGRLSVAQQRVYDDFIRNIWQSQPSQNTNVASAGPPVMSGSVNSSIPRAYGSTSSDANSSVLSTSQAVPGFSATAQQFDLSAEDPERSSTQFLSVSSTNVGVNDGVIQPNAEISPGSVTAPIPSAVNTAEQHSVESSAVTKESGATAQLSPTTSGTERPSVSETSLTTGDALDKYQQVAKKLESLIAKDARDADFQVVVSEVTDIILKSVSRDEVSLAVAQKVFKSLYDGASGSSHIASHIAILDAIRDVCKLVVKELTSGLVYLDEERKFNKEITVALIRSDLINIVEYDVHLSKLMDGGRNKVATEFAIHLVQTLLFNETGFSMSEMCNVMEVLTKLAMKPGAPESLQQLVEMARNLTANATGFTDSKEEKARQARDKKILSGRSSIREEYNINESSIADHSGLQEKVVHFFEEWCRICDFPATDDTMYSHYILQLQQNGWIKGDDVTERVFRTLMMISVARSVVTEQAINPGALLLQTTHPLQHLSYFSIDAYSKLVVLVLKYCSVDQGSSKSFLLNKILSLTVRVIQKDAEDKKMSFSPRPYFRLFVNWLLDLTSPDPALDGANFQVLTSFANAFHSLQPLKVPGWSFAWLELVSHRSFMPKLLTISPQKSWPYFQRLLVDLFKFMEPYLRNADMSEPITFLYKGTLRVLLVLLHDFPEFLCEYHFSFCDVIPPSCIQMRNVILSAFPRNMRLPDPSTPNLKIDLLAEISQPPRILSDYDSALKVKQMKHDVDEYLKTRPEGSSFLTELKQRLLLHQSEASLTGIRYNVPLINSLVLYVGTQAIEQLQSKSTQHAPTQQMSHTPPMDIFLVGAAMDIFQSLIKNLDTEGRYLFLNAVANQLRYPNNHTHYFSFVLLYLFAEASQDIIQEQITRVLLERLIVNRPHPWGLLITFIELIKNPRYNFWNRPFTRCAPEIEKLFESVARSCGGPKSVDDGMVTGGMADGNH